MQQGNFHAYLFTLFTLLAYLNYSSTHGAPPPQLRMALHWVSSLVMGETTFKRVQTQFIAAAIDPVHGEGMQSSSGNGTSSWGIWRVDPGPRGVRLGDYPRLDRSGGKAPAGWQFDKGDWWLEEHGLIMEKPDFPLPPGKYEVTGGREVTTILTVHEDERWELADGAKLYDVTHLPCRVYPRSECKNIRHLTLLSRVCP